MHRSLGKFCVFALSCLLVSSSAAQHYTVTNVGTLDSDTDANALNSYALVVGTSAAPAFSGIVHAFSSKDGNVIDLGTLGGTRSFGEGVNNAGFIVGYSLLAGDSAVDSFV